MKTNKKLYDEIMYTGGAEQTAEPMRRVTKP